MIERHLFLQLVILLLGGLLPAAAVGEAQAPPFIRETIAAEQANFQRTVVGSELEIYDTSAKALPLRLLADLL